MIINRNTFGDVIYYDEAGKEIHPYLGLLAAIESQNKTLPPDHRKLTHNGWSLVCKALQIAIENVGNESNKIDETPEVVDVKKEVTEVLHHLREEHEKEEIKEEDTTTINKGGRPKKV